MPATKRPAWTVLALAVLLAAGCARPDPTAQFPAEPPTTATVPPATLAAADCPMVVVECPRPWVTPGAVIPTTAGVCQASYNPRRSLSTADKRKVLAAYGLPPNQHVSEFDHYVARWAGGRSDLSNVWPAVDPAQVRRKDALEEQLYQAVCHKKTLSLATARARMREFWAWWPAPSPSLRGSHD